MKKLPGTGYSTAAESAKPGYLKRKFDKIRQDQRKQDEERKRAAAETAAKVSTIIRVK